MNRVLILCALVSIAVAQTALAESLTLLDVASPGADKRLAPSSDQVSVSRTNEGGAASVAVAIKPGNDGYPGIRLAPEGSAAWDLSKFGHVAAKITNATAKPLTVSLRIDNPGDWQTNPWNGENLHLQPGASGTAKVFFGYSWGKPGYKLRPNEVSQLLIYTGKTAEPVSFRIESIEAAGTPGEKPSEQPAAVRVKPEDGLLKGKVDAKNAQASSSVDGIHVTLPAGGGEQLAWVRPEVGRWDLRAALEARIRLRNDGAAPVTPRVRLESDRGPTDWIESPTPVPPGGQVELVVPFAAKELWNGEKMSGTKFASDAVAAVTISATPADAERVIVIDSIRAQTPPPPSLPQWLGQRPPVPGDWTMTFNDEFDGSRIDESTWNIYTENYWDKRSHFSKDNVIVGDGVARLRFERKTGYHNDDPARIQTDYATGFLDTYGKWTQRYGYFEARVKLPAAPGLWPAFWLMPDRGEEVGPQWVRASTENGGMEFDILEYLSRWGPYRYNIATHWDGYGEKHKSNGSQSIYVRPDKDGFITAGLLWTPGEAVFYANGDVVGRWTNERVSSVTSYPIFTHVSGGWDNVPLEDDKLPDDFIIDYIRIWQRPDLASEGDGRQP